MNPNQAKRLIAAIDTVAIDFDGLSISSIDDDLEVSSKIDWDRLADLSIKRADAVIQSDTNARWIDRAMTAELEAGRMILAAFESVIFDLAGRVECDPDPGEKRGSLFLPPLTKWNGEAA